MNKYLLIALAIIILIIGLIIFKPKTMTEKTPEHNKKTNANYEIATFAGGCFWCIEAAFEYGSGVAEAVSGYMGGSSKDADYHSVSSGETKHLEVVQVKYDPKEVDYKSLVELFWTQIDPTDADGQFADKGEQYKTAIFYHNDEQKKIAEESKEELAKSEKFDKPIAVKILPAQEFYPAEEYHQNYAEKNSVHYNLYKQGSGRAGFIEKVWNK